MNTAYNPVRPDAALPPNQHSASAPKSLLVEEHAEDATVGTVLRALLRRPLSLLVQRWNWKTALLSALVRGSLFFFTNLRAGWRVALLAFGLEAACYAALAGFYGALLQSFRRAQPAWAATLTMMVILPALNHTVELAVHWLNGTPQLGRSFMISVVFSLLSACFNLFAMRRGVLIVGRERRSLFEDLRLMPRVVVQFVAATPLAVWRTMMK